MSDELHAHGAFEGQGIFQAQGAIQAQGPSWRQPRPSGLDADMRRMLVLAGCVAGGLVLGVGGWSVLGHRPHGIPLIAAPSGPVRVRPVDPGGMQVSGLTDPAMVGDGSDGGTLAPQPETPDPQRLRAQVQAGQAPATGPVPSVSPAPSGGPSGAAPATADTSAPGATAGPAGVAPAAPFTATQPVPAAAIARPPASVAAHPAATLATAALTPPAAVAPTRVTSRPEASSPRPDLATAQAVTGQTATAQRSTAPGTTNPGAVAVQLAAMDSQATADSEWSRLSHRMPDLLDGRHPDITRVDRDGRTLFRVRLGGFGDMAQAIGFCAKVRAKGGGCSIAAF